MVKCGRIMCPVCMGLYKNEHKQKVFDTIRGRNRHISIRHGRYWLRKIKLKEMRR